LAYFASTGIAPLTPEVQASGAKLIAPRTHNADLNEMFITYIDHAFEPDTFFPEFNESAWNKEEVLRYETDEKNPHGFTVYRYWK
jgi:hypothetical protein